MKKLRLAVLKELEKGNKSFTHVDLKIDEEEFVELFKSLERENLIDNVHYYYIPRVDVEALQLTIKGEDYLSSNSALMKGYKGLKELRDWIPFY